MKNWYEDLEPRFRGFEGYYQILNLVSDLVKAKNISMTSPEDARDNCLRAIILLDYILADPKWKSQSVELFRLREVLASLTTTQPMATWNQAIDATLLMEPKAYRFFYNIKDES
ncbi:MAG: hypothetical protein A2Z20_11675 [Bdellovibrionales bacterium RBG_16_40_8]|nr:MAG: hypothetical protein A2Z20_11675 [Bdellovibrionales bacterium RBG_16_40_8]